MDASHAPFTEEELERLREDEDLYNAALKLLFSDEEITHYQVGVLRAIVRGWL